MSDYLQEVKETIINLMMQKGIVDENGNILDKEKYTNWLKQEAARINNEIINHKEPGGQHVNLLYKDLEVVQDMLMATKGSRQKTREEERIEKLETKKSFLEGIKKLFTKRKMTNTPRRGHNK